jgi:hypothetical protein
VRRLIQATLISAFGFSSGLGYAESGRKAENPLPSADPAEVRLDTASIHHLYLDGEFEPAIDGLEKARRNGLLKSHEDSVFAFKHLGVMYAAKYETLEKGKSYMYQLLSIEPSVKIMDMYASDMIYMIFRNVQEEYVLRTGRPSNPADPDTARPERPAPKQPMRWPYWTAGGIAVAGVAGIATYFLFFSGSSSGSHYEGGM